MDNCKYFTPNYLSPKLTLSGAQKDELLKNVQPDERKMNYKDLRYTE